MRTTSGTFRSIVHLEIGRIRQLVINDLGNEDPIFLLANQLTDSAAKLIQRYAERMIIENSIEDSIDFFHMDALSAAVTLLHNLGYSCLESVMQVRTDNM